MGSLELPEIETLRRDLERETATKKIKAVEAVVLKSLPGIKQRKEFGTNLVGAKVVTAERQGMHLLLRLDNEYTLVIELGEHGRLERVASRQKQADDVVAVITFTQGGDLRVGDQKGTSSVQVVHDDDLAEVLPDPEEVGLDLLERPLSWIDLTGPSEVVAICDALEAQYGARFKAPALLREIAANGETFYGRFQPKQAA